MSDDAITPSHGFGEIKPFAVGSVRTKEASRKGVEAKRRLRAETLALREQERLDAEAQAEHQKSMMALLRQSGIADADAVLEACADRPTLVGDLGKAVAVEMMARIMAGEFPIKDAAMAMRLVEVGVKIHRLEGGKPTDIVAETDDTTARIRDVVRNARRGA